MKQILFFVILVISVLVVLCLLNSPSRDTFSPEHPDVPPLRPFNPIQQISPPNPPVLNVLDVLKPTFISAQTNNKKVLIFVSMNNCSWCEKMKKEVFPNLKLNDYAFLETKDSNVANAYKVDGFPTFIIFDKFGIELKRISGYNAQLQTWLDN